MMVSTKVGYPGRTCHSYGGHRTLLHSEAKGLRNADPAGKSDPYCVCELVGAQ